MSIPYALIDRINRVINVPELEASLLNDGIDFIEFQLQWSEYDHFDALPESFRRAILAAEATLPPYVPPPTQTETHDGGEWVSTPLFP